MAGEGFIVVAALGGRIAFCGIKVPIAALLSATTPHFGGQPPVEFAVRVCYTCVKATLWRACAHICCRRGTNTKAMHQYCCKAEHWALRSGRRTTHGCCARHACELIPVRLNTFNQICARQENTTGGKMDWTNVRRQFQIRDCSKGVEKRSAGGRGESDGATATASQDAVCCRLHIRLSPQNRMICSAHAAIAKTI